MTDDEELSEAKKKYNPDVLVNGKKKSGARDYRPDVGKPLVEPKKQKLLDRLKQLFSKKNKKAK